MSVSFNINVSDVTVCKCISFANVIVCVYVCVRPCERVCVCVWVGGWVGGWVDGWVGACCIREAGYILFI